MDGEVVIGATIVGLGLGIYETTILRRVPEVVVLAIDRATGEVPVLQGPLVEPGEVVPFLADGDAPPAVAVVVVIVGIEAAVSHLDPVFVDRGLRQSVSGQPSGGDLSMKAAATVGVATCQLALGDLLLGSALAHAPAVRTHPLHGL